MQTNIYESKAAMGDAAAEAGARALREAIDRDGQANIIVATGASQFEVLESLVGQPDLAWEKVGVFHLDEYVGLPITHPASFRQYLWERFHRKLPRPVRAFHYLDAEHDPEAEAERVGAILREHPISVCFCGIGENGHLAFNDPPADFEADQPYLVLDLDEDCRKQQLGEGWFPSLSDVPGRAISMSIRQILKSESIICTVPDQRKAVAVKKTVEGPVTPGAPASILQQHDRCALYMDKPAASKLGGAAK